MSANRQIAATVCTVCGVTCDDLVLEVEANNIVAAERACELGREWFVGQSAGETACYVNGKVASLETACKYAAGLLNDAEYPLVCGLTDCTTEAQQSAIALADRVGGVIDWTTDDSYAVATLSLQTAGAVTASWGEAAQRADMVIYWASDPTVTHPRMAERYTEQPTSRWLPNGRSDRFVVVIDDQSNSTTDGADQAIRLAEDRHYAALHVLRGLAKGLEFSAAEVKSATGEKLSSWQSLLDRMIVAKFGAVVFGKRLAAAGPAVITALMQLMAELTSKTRWVALAEGSPGNATGAAAALTWQAGSPLAVDFAQGVPHYRPLEATSERLLSRGEVDTLLSVGVDLMPKLNDAELAHWHQIPRIVVSHERDIDPTNGHVVIATARPGIDASGTSYRGDGIPLPRRAALAAARPTAEAILNLIRQQVGQ